MGTVPTGNQGEHCVHWRPGVASGKAPILAGRIGTVPTGNRGEHCVHWRPGVVSGKVPIIAGGMGTVPIGNQGGHGAHWQPKRALCPLAVGGGKWHDAIPGGWNE